ncbi:F0F1 ATP synthase subunit epsilon [Sporosarcina pasteurii]|uniref:ATP synthase epsilon chain n=1 Tax=Sporosarcina pasteurii TaxID=1474 RepID=A0A380BCG5_SPOPA|nr:F0F1 ATP synthase subunit epsilon [Sporosarcina pasteurii]MDS9472268.1 F0F1 ATP synthase subunit epsilon [Sporosarcina pasteurii]QBQ06249.1 F0F1 ATP synthase subunit epsilon [Sporosarcina pasteurii]SUI99110.1 F-ATPase epsilon subunit [Sporosarcina pasteurii]
MKTLQVNIVTPDGPVLETEADMVIATTETGELGILPDHIAMVAPLKIGGLRVQKGDSTDVVAVHGGFIEVRPEVVTVLASAAETADTIDVARAKIAENRAKAKLQAEKDEKELRLAELELQRAINRIRVGEGKF